jgi:uncharacterized protein YeaO (DUF488 family)
MKRQEKSPFPEAINRPRPRGLKEAIQKLRDYAPRIPPPRHLRNVLSQLFRIADYALGAWKGQYRISMRELARYRESRFNRIRPNAGRTALTSRVGAS